MNTSSKGIELLKHLEGLRLKAYPCSAGVATIFWGCTVYPDGTKVKLGDTGTIEQAEKCFQHDLRIAENAVNKAMFDFKFNLTQCQFDSLVCFVFNVGEPRFRSSTLLKVISGHKTEIPIETAFLMWNKEDATSDGKDNDGDGLIDEPGEKRSNEGLTNRRKSEAWLFLHDEIKYFA